MAKYYLNGYTPPQDVTSPEKVKEYQKQLGVTVDGIWGPKTQAAYDKVYGNSNSNSNSSSSAPTVDNHQKTFWNYYNSILSGMSVPTINADIPSKSEVVAEISDFLRPAYDEAIAQRRKDGKSNMAEIDADAVARGMGSSTFVTSMKNREQNDVSDDIAKYENNYASTLAKTVYDAMLSYRNQKLEADKFNAEAKQNAQNTAFSAAKILYQSFLDRQAALANASSSHSSSSSSSNSSSSKEKDGKQEKEKDEAVTLPKTYSYSDCIFYLSSLSREELRLLQTSTSKYWSSRRDDLYDSLGEFQYMKLLGPNGEFYYKNRR